MFELQTPIPELILRGTLLFVLFMVLFRILPRRTGGELAPMDLVFLLLVTESASHSLGDFDSLPDGAVQIVTLMALNYLTNRASFASPAIMRLVEHAPIQIIRDGQAIPRNLRRELLTAEELHSHLRLNGIDDIARVKSAHVESDGRLSVIRADEESDQGGGDDGSSKA